MKDALRDSAKLRLQPSSSLRRIRSSIRASLFFDSDDEDSQKQKQQQQRHHRGSEPAIDTQQTLVGPSSTLSDDHLVRTLTEPHAEEENANEGEGEAGRRRTRSFSETLGSLFRSSRKKSDAEEEEGEEGE